MTDIHFSQPERRSYLIPALIVLVVVGIVAGLIYRFTPHHVAEITVTHVDILPNHTVFHTDSIKVGAQDATEDDLYVVATVRVQDQLKLPIFIKDFTGTLTASDGGEVTSSAVEKRDLPSLYMSFPKLKPMVGPLLERETSIQPGQTAEGVVVLHFPVTQEIWDKRTEATITVDTYHQGPFTIPLPKP